MGIRVSDVLNDKIATVKKSMEKEFQKAMAVPGPTVNTVPYALKRAELRVLTSLKRKLLKAKLIL